jgi:hypothetical protein
VCPQFRHHRCIHVARHAADGHARAAVGQQPHGSRGGGGGGGAGVGVDELGFVEFAADAVVDRGFRCIVLVFIGLQPVAALIVLVLGAPRNTDVVVSLAASTQGSHQRSAGYLIITHRIASPSPGSRDG